MKTYLHSMSTGRMPKASKTKACPCGKKTGKFVKGLCNACYNKKQWKKKELKRRSIF